MTVSFTVIVILDGPAQRWIGLPAGTILGILIASLIILAQCELSNLAAAKNLKIFTPISAIASILLAGTWYWRQIIETCQTTVKIPLQLYLLFLLTFILLALLLYQYIRYGTMGVLANCGANCFSIIYLGLLSSFVIGIRLDFSVRHLLLFIFVIKSSDIGAYAMGSLLGKHKFSPKISSGKTWEGMAGGVVFALLVAFILAASFDIMVWWLALIYGFCFAFLGQAGDLVESMIKRDAEKKDSANIVPSFGGILDSVDSPLLAAPFAYLFFIVTN